MEFLSLSMGCSRSRCFADPGCWSKPAVTCAVQFGSAQVWSSPGKDVPLSLRFALLGVLDARPMTGYELAQFFDHSASWVWSAPHSNIYTQLKRMEEDGLLSSDISVKGEKLNRTVYTVTDEGRDSLRDWVVSDPGGSNTRDPMLLRAIFFDDVDPSEAVGLLSEMIGRQQEQILQWQEHRAALLAKATPLLRERLQHRPEAEHDRIAAVKANVFTGMIESARVWIRWAESTIKLLRDD